MEKSLNEKLSNLNEFRTKLENTVFKNLSQNVRSALSSLFLTYVLAKADKASPGISKLKLNFIELTNGIVLILPTYNKKCDAVTIYGDKFETNARSVFAAVCANVYKIFSEIPNLPKNDTLELIRIHGDTILGIDKCKDLKGIKVEDFMMMVD